MNTTNTTVCESIQPNADISGKGRKFDFITSYFSFAFVRLYSVL